MCIVQGLNRHRGTAKQRSRHVYGLPQQQVPSLRITTDLYIIVMNFSEKKLWRRLMMTVGFTRGILFERMMRDSSPLWAGGHGGGGCGPDHGIVGICWWYCWWRR